MPDRRQLEAEHDALVAGIQTSIDAMVETSRDAKHLIAQSRDTVTQSCELLARVGAQLERR